MISLNNNNHINSSDYCFIMYPTKKNSLSPPLGSVSLGALAAMVEKLSAQFDGFNKNLSAINTEIGELKANYALVASKDDLTKMSDAINNTNTALEINTSQIRALKIKKKIAIAFNPGHNHNAAYKEIITDWVSTLDYSAMTQPAEWVDSFVAQHWSPSDKYTSLFDKECSPDAVIWLRAKLLTHVHNKRKQTPTWKLDANDSDCDVICLSLVTKLDQNIKKTKELDMNEELLKRETFLSNILNIGDDVKTKCLFASLYSFYVQLHKGNPVLFGAVRDYLTTTVPHKAGCYQASHETKAISSVSDDAHYFINRHHGVLSWALLHTFGFSYNSDPNKWSNVFGETSHKSLADMVFAEIADNAPVYFLNTGFQCMLMESYPSFFTIKELKLTPTLIIKSKKGVWKFIKKQDAMDVFKVALGVENLDDDQLIIKRKRDSESDDARTPTLKNRPLSK